MIEFITSKKFLLPIVYIALGIIIYSVVKIIISKISKNKHMNKKKITIISLVKNIVKYLIFIFIILGILNTFGVDTTSIIASIGVAGVIIGLAFQDIIADFLAGIFIIFDNQYKLGDIISVNGFKGEVISLGLMSTKIKAATGEVMILGNSSFTEVINYSANNKTYYIDIDVSYDTDINKLEKVLNDMKEKVEKIDGYVGNYKLLGINEFADSSIKYLITFECRCDMQYQVKRDFNKILKNELDRSNIEIPYKKIDINIRGNNE
ncbi:MAG: mechanosensitive ion channel family protein [Bacilli bacterium]|nr:mechanosensitive ion channel family protein [Bacilli bacterium]